jgi:hypothetical protein
VTGQQFSRVTVATNARADSKSLNEVLANFQVEQTGDRVRIVDADGSVYEGNLAAMQTEREKDAMERKGSGLQKSSKEAGAKESAFGELVNGQSYRFRVAGTNRTVNQLVVFEGNLVAVTNAIAQSAEGSKSAAMGGENRVPTSSIQGRARIGVSNEIEINALPVPR